MGAWGVGVDSGYVCIIYYTYQHLLQQRENTQGSLPSWSSQLQSFEYISIF